VPIGNRLIGQALHILGDQPGARRHLEPLVRSRVATAPSSHIILYQYDQRVLLDCYYARVLWLQGFGDQARRLTESLVDYVRPRDHMLSFVYSLLIAACPIALYVGDLTTAADHVSVASEVATRNGLEIWNVWAQCFKGVVLIKRGEHGAGAQLLQSGLERLPEPAIHHHMSLLLAELAAGLGSGGQITEGLGVVDRALARAEQTEAGWYLAELLRTKGELLLLGQGPSTVATAEACFRQALDVARRQGALSWELRSATSLARLWSGQRRVNEARKLLGPVYRRFTEGFETADLVAARTLLASVR
jgi:ATP/maltotriose-dependent transcriptional regulator MalT